MKKYIILGSGILLTLLIMVGCLYYPVFNFNLLKDQIIAWDSDGKEVTATGRKITEYKKGYDFFQAMNQFSQRYEFVLTDNNPINPVVSHVSLEKTGIQNITINLYQLKRNGLFSYDLFEQRGLKVQNKTFDEALALAKQYDLSKYNPDPANIIINPAPTRDEVERRKQVEQESIELANQRLKERADKDTKYNKDLIDFSNNKLSKDESIIFCNELVLKYKELKDLIPIFKQNNNDQTPSNLTLVDKALQQITPLLDNQCKVLGVEYKIVE